MLHKSDVQDFIMDVNTQYKSLFKKPIKVIRTDNGAEYVSAKMLKFYKDNQIVLERSTPYDHEQLGKAERWNRTVIEGGRANLFQSGLPAR